MIKLSEDVNEKLEVFRNNVEIHERFELVTPIYRKIKRYALQWRSVWWSPHFYDIVDQIDHFRRIPYCGERMDENSFVEVTLTTFLRHNPIRVPRSCPKYDASWFFDTGEKPTALADLDVNFTVSEYYFPRMGKRIRLSREMVVMRHQIVSNLRENFLRECEYQLITENGQLANNRP